MQTIKKLPVDLKTWREMNYNPLYYVPNSPFQLVANSAIKFYTNRLTELERSLTEDNKTVFREAIKEIEKMMR